MAALARPRGSGQRRSWPVWRWVILVLAAVYFLIPLFAALRFAGIGAFRSVISEPGFTSSLGLSVRLAVVTTVITIVLMLPTAVYVHLRLPKLRRLLEGITILPIVVPPVVLTVALVLGEFTMASLALFETFPVWIVVNDRTGGQVSVAASLLALFVTWLFLMVITVIGTRQSRRTGGGSVTLFTVARQGTRGTNDHQHRQERRHGRG